LYTHEAELVPGTQVKNSRTLTATPGGGFEIDANTAFEQVIGAIDDLYQKCGIDAARARFGAVSSFWHSIVGVDDYGEPTTKLFAWAETRPAAFVAQLKRDLNERDVQNRTGCPIHSSYWPAKILWIWESFPAGFAATQKWLSFSDFMGQRVFGCPDTSVSMASGSGIFDLRLQQWDREIVEYLGIDIDSLPNISEDQSPSLEFTEEYKKRWPEIAGTKWLPAVGDGAANNIGAGCFTREKAALMIGTSGAMRVAYEGDPPETIPKGLWCYRVDSKRVVIGGAISDGGGLYRWLKDNLRVADDDDKLRDLVAQRGPAAHGLTFLPFLAGERSTGYNDFATGAILGLRSATDNIDIIRAAFESVAYRFAEIYERLCEVLEIEEIVASGGALRQSTAWTQIICDVLGRDMVLPGTREASSRGIVLLAAMKTGFGSGLSNDDASEATHFSHNPSNREAYQIGRKRHEHFYQGLVRR